jgi:hypothetical protein
LGLALSALFALPACASNAQASVIEQAERDFNCDHVEARRIASTSSSTRGGSCGRGAYVVEGCGYIAHYVCTDTDAPGCDYECEQIHSNELRSN